MNNEERQARKNSINEELRKHADEIGQLSLEIMKLEGAPAVKVSVEITNIMAMCNVKIHAELMGPKGVEELKSSLGPMYDMMLKDLGVDPSLREEASAPPEEQVEDILKRLNEHLKRRNEEGK